MRNRLLRKLVCALAVLFTLGSGALAQKPFISVFTKNAPGDIALIGNAVLVKPGGATPGPTEENNDISMVYATVDPSAPAPGLDSSTSDLNIPAGSTVLFAGLFWGGSYPKSGVTFPTSGTTTTISLKLPGGSYQTLTGDVYSDMFAKNEDRAWGSFKDITSLVKGLTGSPNGTYSAANIWAGNGQNCCGGWSIAIAYTNASLPPRNLTIFNGYQVITTGTGSGVGSDSVTVGIGPFITPKSEKAHVNAVVGVMGYEGDAGITGDQLLFNGVQMSDALHSATNYWCSAISNTGTSVTTRDPNFTNALGLDLSTVLLANPSNGVLGLGATSATITFTTTGDTYYPAMLTTAIDLYAPVVTAAKTTLDLNGNNVTPGDILQYTVNLGVTGGDDAGNCVLVDPLPPQLRYVPGSIVVSGSMVAGAKTDATGDDQGEFVTGSNAVVVRLGTGATSGTGGTILIGGSTTVTFQVQVSGTVPHGTQIDNQAQFYYNSVANPTLSLATASTVATVDSSRVIQGTVFEDVNYSGGAGRGPLTNGSSAVPPASISYPTGAVPLNGVRVELYDSSGAFLQASTTGTSVGASGTANGPGVYQFSQNVPAGDYTVRVVSTSATSSRTGSIAGLIPVQTYRTEGGPTTNVTIGGSSAVLSGTVSPVADHVGGENPALADAGANLTSANLSTLTSGSTAAQCITHIHIGVDDVLQADFGFNFDTVVNTNASGGGSLDQFIKNANALSGVDTAIFMIPNGTSAAGLRSSINSFNGGAYASITQNSTLTTVTAPVIISGSSQPGYSAGGAPVIEINGSGVAGAGLTVSGGGSTIDTLAINRCGGAAITLSSAGNNAVTGCVIGANPAGTSALPNGSGILINGSPGNTIGGTTAAARNILSGNTGNGLEITGAAATLNLVYGNYIGVAADGATAMGNGKCGVLIDTSAASNKVGGTASGASNIISANGTGGVVIGVSASANSILRNSIYGNTGLGIDLSAAATTGDGVTPNNGAVGSGANSGMDYPIMQSALLTGGNVTVTGFVGSGTSQAAFANSVIEFYKADNSPADQNGLAIAGTGSAVAHGEGRTYLGTVTTGANGNFSTTLTGLALNDLVTAIATNPTNNTSEFGPDIAVANPVVGGTVTGFVYNDSNRNGQKDSGETGTGLTLYAKIFLSSSGTGPAISGTAVDPATGAYSFAGVAPGNYTIVINGTNDLNNVTPGYPAGWTGTEFTPGIHSNIAVTTQNPTSYNFGLVQATTITGIVFTDTGTGGGTANNGTKDGGEIGLGGATVTLTDATGAVVYDKEASAADGTFTLSVSGTVPSGTLKITEVNPAGMISTGANVGTLTSGTYSRPTDTITFTYATSGSYSGVQFGDIPGPNFTTDGQQNGMPGTILFYPHTFTLNTSGTVTFSAAHTSNPGTVTGWSETFFLDANGNGKLDSGEPQITGPIAIASATNVNILVKEFIPGTAPINAQNSVVVSAVYSDANATPALTGTLTRTDLTIVGSQTTSGLVLNKSVDVQSAKPGDTITYTVTYSNNTSDSLSNIVVYDSTPTYTTFLSGTWTTPLPTAITAIAPVFPTVGASGSAGSMHWTMTGTLQPAATGTLSFQVKVAP